MNSSFHKPRRWWLPAAWVLGAVLLGVSACSNPPATQPPKPAPPEVVEANPDVELPEGGRPLFQDVTAAAGIDCTFYNGQEAEQYAILDSLGGGIALIDYDGDGLLDIFVPGGGRYEGPDKKLIRGRPCKLYKNKGNFQFQDVTKEVGLEGIHFYTHGAAVADYDRDGFSDLLVTGYGRMALFHNVKDEKAPGGRAFRDVSVKAGLVTAEQVKACEEGMPAVGPDGKLRADHFWSTSAAWADFDGDGYPDLYVCQYVNWSWLNNPRCGGYSKEVTRDVCPPKSFLSRPHVLFRNKGDGTFQNVTEEAGIRMPGTGKDWKNDYGKGLGVIAADLKGDGRPDLFVANDTSGNFLYLNQTRRPGQIRFVEVSEQCNVYRDDRFITTGSMGIDVGDYNGTGRPSVWITNYEGEYHALFRNDGPPQAGQTDRVLFQFATGDAWISRIGQRFVAFGTGFLDIDNHGWEDLFISNGHVVQFPLAGVEQPPILLRNCRHPKGQRVYVNVSGRAGSYFKGLHCGRGVAIGDLNNDGLPDVVVSHMNGRIALLRNEAQHGHHWLGIELAGEGRRDVVGARLELEAGGRTLTRFAKGGGSYLSSGDRRHLFGLGQSTKIDKLTVYWPSGEQRVQHWSGNQLPTDRYWRLVQGQKEPAVPSYVTKKQ